MLSAWITLSYLLCGKGILHETFFAERSLLIILLMFDPYEWYVIIVTTKKEWSMYKYPYIHINVSVCLSSQHKCTWLHSHCNSLLIAAVILLISVLSTCVAVPFEAENIFSFLLLQNQIQNSLHFCVNLWML